MKNSLLLIPFLLFSCAKKEVATKTSANQDSLKAVDQTVVETPVDSLHNGLINQVDSVKIKEDLRSSRVIEGNKIIKTINADRLPLNFEDELTADQGQMIIKIKNFTGKKISGTVTSLKPGLSIRFNQIRLADGEYDGPFGQEINYDIKDKGEIWLIIGKNLMATTETAGKFKVSLK